MSIFAYPLDGDQNYTASQCGAFFAGRSSGVFSAEDNLRVSVSGARQLSVSPGIAWITTDTYWGKVFVSTDPVYFDLPTADGVLDVICRVVVQWNKTTNTPSILMKQGTFAPEPEPPARSTTDELYELVLADYLVQHGEIEASESRLTDQRLNEDLCGLMRDGVERIPTDALQAQALAIIQMIEQAYADVISGNVPPHAVTHATGGSDELTPDDIGAASLDQNGKVTASQTSAAYATITGDTALASDHEGKTLKVTADATLTLGVLTDGCEIEVINYGASTVTLSGTLFVAGEGSATACTIDENAVAVCKYMDGVWFVAGGVSV